MLQLLTIGEIVELIARYLSDEKLKITFSGDSVSVFFHKRDLLLLKINLHINWNDTVCFDADESLPEDTLTTLYQIASEFTPQVVEKFRFLKDISTMRLSYSFTQKTRDEKINYMSLLVKEGFSDYEQFRKFCETRF